MASIGGPDGGDLAGGVEGEAHAAARCHVQPQIAVAGLAVDALGGDAGAVGGERKGVVFAGLADGFEGVAFAIEEG